MSDSTPTVDQLMDANADSRPEFLGPLSGDKVFDAIMRLAMEVCVLRDRMDAYEALAGSDAGSLRKQVEAFQASPELEAERVERRRTLVRRLLRDLR